MLQRQQLRPISAAAWRNLLAQDWPAAARPCLAHWAAQDLPLAVTRQATEPSEGPEALIQLGLPAPSVWGRQRLTIQVPRAALGPARPWPTLAALSQHAAVRPRLGEDAAQALQALAESLMTHGVRAQVYGSHGWQVLTGLDHLRDGSDLDLWLPIDGPLGDGLVAQRLADTAVQRLQSLRTDLSLPRLDGELGFSDGAAVAWREWAEWRAGRCRQLMVKRLGAVELIDTPASARAGRPRARA